MVPSKDSSTGKQRLGLINKQGNSLLRFLLVEAAQAASRINPEWRRRYIHLAMRRDYYAANGALREAATCLLEILGVRTVDHRKRVKAITSCCWGKLLEIPRR